MVEISASMVKELREKSGAAMMDCKKALVETSGDLEKAYEWLRQKGAATASKKSSRATSEGLVVGKVAENGKFAVLLEINCETDFVARNDQFKALCDELIDLALQHKPKDVESFLTVKAAKGTVQELVTEAIQKTGENIVLKRLVSYELDGEGAIGMYVHTLGGKMGALIEIKSTSAVDSGALSTLGRELAMHTVSTKPQYLSKDNVPAETIEQERRIESGKADLANKKPEMQEKIVQGRVEKILAERCLLQQPFVKDPSVTVDQHLAAKSKELSTELKPTRFSLYILGEGE